MKSVICLREWLVWATRVDCFGRDWTWRSASSPLPEKSTLKSAMIESTICNKTAKSVSLPCPVLNAWMDLELEYYTYQNFERLFRHLRGNSKKQIVLMLICKCTSIYDLRKFRTLSSEGRMFMKSLTSREKHNSADLVYQLHVLSGKKRWRAFLYVY